MSKSTESTKPEVVENYSADQMAAERADQTHPGTDTVVVNQETMQAGQTPSLNFPASAAYVATITAPAESEAAEGAPVKAGKDWWTDGAGEAWRKDQIVGVSIPRSGKTLATDRVALRLASGTVVHAPVSDPQTAWKELTR